MVPEICCAKDGWTDRQMDRKSDIQMWVPHLKTLYIHINHTSHYFPMKEVQEQVIGTIHLFVTYAT